MKNNKEILKTKMLDCLKTVLSNLPNNLIRKLQEGLCVVAEQDSICSKVFSHVPDSRKNEIVFLDVGANIGQTSIKFYRALSSQAKTTVYCFEPFSDNFKELSKNTSHFSNIHPFKLGIGSSKSIMTIPLAPHSEWHSIANMDAWKSNSSKEEEISITTLDIFVEENSLSLSSPIILKTDTEGYDLHVLQGAKLLLQKKAIDIVICEVGFNQEDKQHSYFPDIYSYLMDFGYRVYLIEDQAVFRHPLWNNVLSLGYANAWFVSPALEVI